MANYHEYALTEAVEAEDVGVGIGDTTSGRLSLDPVGEIRICISLGAKPIDWPEGEKPEGYDWISMTPESVFALVSQLETFRHIWDTPEIRKRRGA